MFKKAKRIIQREKIKHPAKPSVVLLFRRILQVLQIKINEKQMMLTKNSTFRSKDVLYMSSLLPRTVLGLILEKIKPKSILDVGCGTGVSLSYFIKHGVDAFGIENSKVAILQAENPERIIRHNLNKEISLGKNFDLVWCFEVIEHIHPDYEDVFLETITRHGRLIILSAARPGQGGHGHFNEQNPEYWINRFNHLGFGYDLEFTDELKKTKDLHAENILVFRHNLA